MYAIRSYYGPVALLDMLGDPVVADHLVVRARDGLVDRRPGRVSVVPWADDIEELGKGIAYPVRRVILVRDRIDPQLADQPCSRGGRSGFP